MVDFETSIHFVCGGVFDIFSSRGDTSMERVISLSSSPCHFHPHTHVASILICTISIISILMSMSFPLCHFHPGTCAVLRVHILTCTTCRSFCASAGFVTQSSCFSVCKNQVRCHGSLNSCMVFSDVCTTVVF